MVMFSKNWLSSLFSMIENGYVVVKHARGGFAVDNKMTHAQCEGLLSPKGLPSCSDNYLLTKICEEIDRPIKLSGRALYDDGQMTNRNVINHVTKELLR